jgi:hypothetical protein
MQWLIPVLLLVAAVAFWRLAFYAKDELVAWCRSILACFLLILALIYSVAMLAHWVMG